MIVETTIKTPEPAASNGYKTISREDFINDLKNPTAGDLKEPGPGDQPKPPAPKPEAGETVVVAKMLVNLVDVIMQMGCQAISGEPDENLFKASEAQKKQIQDPLVEVMDFYKWNIDPRWILIIVVLGVYAPTTFRAVTIRNKKTAAKKAAVVRPTPGATTTTAAVEIKRPAGRPVGTTKEELEKRKAEEKRSA